MNTVKVNFLMDCGKIKPMNAVNNGPIGGGVRGKTGNFLAYQEANIPYARLHDSAFYSGYGGEWSVDVHRIFRDFNADENDPNSYVFGPTDKYLQNIKDAGTEIFYRLGASIEHGMKYGTYPPKDFAKWARICEHIILHYNEGWANGFHMNIRYWEIWNEPDCVNADGSNPCWQGTEDEFLTFYTTVSKYLKEKFPALKIGGPAICWWGSGLSKRFLPAIKQSGAPLDFFSYHTYAKCVEDVARKINMVKEALCENGFDDAETILNEWNYVRGWLDENWKYSLRTEKSLKGSSFVLGAMCISQASTLDMLMYYDARPCGMNGMFHTDTLQPLKTYYVIKAFGELYKMGTCLKTEVDGANVYACTATDGVVSETLVTYFDDNDEAECKEVKIDFNNVSHSGKIKVEIYLLDEEHDSELIREEIFTANNFSVYQKMKLYSSLFLKLIPVEK